MAEDEIETDACDDAELVARARRGDARAFAQIYARHAHAVAATARRLLGASADADDVVQETFLIAFEQLDRVVELAALRGWLMQIAVSRAHRRFRQRRTSRLATEDPHAAIDQQPASGASPEQCAELSLIERALRLPAKLRTPWRMRRVDGAALGDVALACKCSLATAKRRLAEADAAVARLVCGAAGEVRARPPRADLRRAKRHKP